MGSRRFIRSAAASGVVGGALWLVGTVLHASRPVGCVAEECARRTMRESSALEGMLVLAALLLIAVTAAALVALARGVGRFGATAKAGIVLAVVGVSVVVFAGVVQALVFDGDFLLMPSFLIPGMTALLVGSGLSP